MKTKWKEGDLRADSWVEQGLKSIAKKNNTAGKLGVAGGGEAEDDGGEWPNGHNKLWRDKP